ncbi:MAG: phosphoadenylyl-sulfate reductase [Flavobacteriaceae bacterium]|jgi:phosphoadenosine phosphosulfate reductase|nr:phosphoadenylyl-sulfate reductase [Flavobacteriaceae bacterium]
MSIYDKIELINKNLDGLSLLKAFEYIIKEVDGEIAFSTSFGQEDQVLTDTIFSNDLNVEIFTLDTGRLFPETYEVFHKTLNKYKKSIKSYTPDTLQLEQFITEKGPNSFYNSFEDRKECCRVRKIEPLKRALRGKRMWVTGLRAGQSENRSATPLLEWDSNFEILKFNPLINWSLEAVEAYLDEHKVPQNSLHKKGFVSIGCQPCTRAIEPGEDLRAGRWWWESSKKECGLHATNKN